MTKFDRESFNLLKMTDSASDSVPDLAFDIPQNSRQKKKVRLKRKERKPRGGPVGGPASLARLQGPWSCCLPSLPLPSPSTLLAAAGFLAALAVVAIGFFTSNLHYKIQVLEAQLQTKIVDDDAKSLPAALEAIQSRLKSLESNQSTVASQLGQINTVVTRLGVRLDSVNISLSVSEEDPALLRKNVVDLRLGVGEVTKHLELVVNRSVTNKDAISQLSKELDTLKLGEPDMATGQATTVPSTSGSLGDLGSQLDSLTTSLEQHSNRLDIINSTVLSIEHNSTTRIDLEHKDVVGLSGKVSQLQDDNLNVSSSLASLSVRCSSQLQGLHYNVTRLQQRLARVEARQAVLLEGQEVVSPVAGEQQGVDRLPAGESREVASPNLGEGQGVASPNIGEGQGEASPAPLRKASQTQGNIGTTLEGVGRPLEPRKDLLKLKNQAP